MSLGKEVRLARLLDEKTGRLCAITLDHPITRGVLPGLENVREALSLVCAGRPDAVTLQKGIARSCFAPYAGKVALITPWATAPKATLDSRTNASKKYVFRACFIDPFQGGVVAKFTLDNLKFRKAAVLYDVASEYNKGIAEIFKTVFEQNGGKIVAFETYTTNDKDFSSQLTKIRQAAPEIIFLPNYYSEVPLQIQQAKRLGIAAPFIGADAWGSEELLKLCGSDCEGYYFSTHYAADAAGEATRKFIADYRSRYSATPDDVAALTYDSFGLLKEALATAGKNDRQAVRDALARIPRYDGVTGTMQFREGSGDPVKSAVILKIRDGKFTWFADAKP